MQRISEYNQYVELVRALASRQKGRIIHVHVERHGDPEPGPSVDEAGLPDPLSNALKRYGIERLHKFQFEALKAYREGGDLIIVAGTGTGKTEAFMIPVLEDIIRLGESVRRPYAIVMYPTKALARDQIVRMKRLAEGMLGVKVRVLDGDTPRGERTEIYADPPHILVTNPDMMHYGMIYSHHIRRLVSRAKVLILDETHVYNGVFGSHVRWVIYRMERLAGSLRVVGAGATIGNPESLGEKLFGRKPKVIEGPPRRRGTAIHLLVDIGSGSRWSLAAAIISSLSRRGLKVLGFVDSQQMAELIARIARRSFGVEVGVHRAGLPPSYRRKVEEDFRSGKINAVVATPTMELGIDLGDLDVVVMAHLPHSYNSYVQRAGRAGRRGKPGLIITLLGDDAIEAYFARRPKEFFSQKPSPSYIEPGNPEIARTHLVALLLQEGILDEASLPREMGRVVDEIIALGLAKRLGGKLYPNWKAAKAYLDSQEGLRSSGPRVAIYDGSEEIGYREMPSALYDLYPGAIYYHAGRAYVSLELDLEKYRAKVRKLDGDVGFYTKPLYTVDVTDILEEDERTLGPLRIIYAEVKLVVIVTGYVVREEYTGRKLYVQEYREPVTWSYRTKAMITRYPNPGIKSPTRLISGYHALEHALISAARPVVGVSDTDLGGISYPSGHIVIYDSTPGGHGGARLVFERLEKIHDIAENILSDCDCEDGCPKCVYSPYCGNNNMFLSRRAALEILRNVFRLERLGKVRPMKVEAPTGKPLA